ncbi:MAG: hypothetical protein V3581_04145 [Candidatus Cardinium sp.]|uniref:hypothetical protein n=1 Tax=Candidatus Cardinium sp. TP TaxID=2961955 RepID=UPI0021AFD3EA|nr:hypothetical protein [Candidatus Cardinium sp. TP]MCT4697318.1 hypothetical protein [Candidatus Cardinium sp. TP]MDN5247270.1 hypothetical protein [Candidatus Cardinium sp.]
MKTYRNARVSLFIGLLSLNTLASCVNTREELGANNRRYRSGCCTATVDNMMRVKRRHPGWFWSGIAGGVTALSLVFIGGGYGLYYNVFGNNTGHNNDTGLATSTPFPLNNGSTTVTPSSTTPYLEDTTLKFITDAIEKGEEKWGSSSTTTTITTTVAPLVVQDPNVITDEIVKDLDGHAWSLESVKKWLDAGLHVNATDPKGCNMWNRVSQLKIEEPKKRTVLDFLDGQNIDVNKAC